MTEQEQQTASKIRNTDLAIAFLMAILIGLLAFGYNTATAGEIHRSQKARLDFVKANKCPATGKNKLPCKGYVIDHVKPLCAGGADSPTNMQWQTVADAKKKDIGEKQQCAILRKQVKK